MQNIPNELGPPEDLFMLAINWRKDDCWAGQENNYRAKAMSGITLGHIKTCLPCPELNIKHANEASRLCKNAQPVALQ